MHGVWTALITPFDRSNQIDFDAYKKILNDQKQAGISGVIPCGTTGEAPCLTLEEKKALIETALKELKGSKTQVVAGTGSNDTASTLEFSRWASDQGVKGVLVVTPYYNKPSQAGLEAHFRAVANEVKCDVILYNVPGRTGVSLTTETIIKLTHQPRITAIKEASGNLAFLAEIKDSLSVQGRSLTILSGDDVYFLPSLALGAQGIVSVASNLFPRAMVSLYQDFQAGELEKAREIHENYYPLFRDLFIESNPGPIKAAMSYAGWCENRMRLPLVPLSQAHQKKLEESLKHCKIAIGRSS